MSITLGQHVAFWLPWPCNSETVGSTCRSASCCLTRRLPMRTSWRRCFLNLLDSTLIWDVVPVRGLSRLESTPIASQLLDLIPLTILAASSSRGWQPKLKYFRYRGGHFGDLWHLIAPVCTCCLLLPRQVSGLLNTGEVPNLFNAEDSSADFYLLPGQRIPLAFNVNWC